MTEIDMTRTNGMEPFGAERMTMTHEEAFLEIVDSHAEMVARCKALDKRFAYSDLTTEQQRVHYMEAYKVFALKADSILAKLPD